MECRALLILLNPLLRLVNCSRASQLIHYHQQEAYLTGSFSDEGFSSSTSMSESWACKTILSWIQVRYDCPYAIPFAGGSP